METILVPLDGSLCAEQVLPHVQLLACALGARVLLLQVLPPEEHWHVHRPHLFHTAEVNGPAVIDPPVSFNPPLDLLKRKAADYLATHAVALQRAGVDTITAVRFGGPAEIISEIAEAEHVALVALTLRGTSRFRCGLSGSVAEHVLHACTAPLLIVHADAQARPAIQRILVPLDGSLVSQQALPLALRLARAAQATLIVAHAVAPTLEVFPATPLPGAIQEALAAAAMTELQTLMQEIQTQHVPVTTTVMYGNAAEVITQIATTHNVDMIVMTTHGYSGLRRWVLGSVAERVLQLTQTPLLLVHAVLEANN